MCFRSKLPGQQRFRAIHCKICRQRFQLQACSALSGFDFRFCSGSDFLRIALRGRAEALVAGSDVSRNRSALQRGPIAETERHIVNVAVTPSLRGVVTLDDGMLRRVKMLARVPMG